MLTVLAEPLRRSTKSITPYSLFSPLFSPQPDYAALKVRIGRVLFLLAGTNGYYDAYCKGEKLVAWGL